MKRQLILALFLTVFVLPLSVYGFGGHVKWWKEPKIVGELELTREQVNQIEGVFSSYKGQISELESNLKKKGRKLRGRIKDPNSTRLEIQTLTDDTEKTKGELRDIKVDMYLRIRDVLTPRQRIKLQEIKERYGE